MVERRRYKRVEVGLPIKLNFLAQGGERDFCHSIVSNVSAGGVYFKLPKGKRVGMGDKVDIEFTIPPGVGRVDSSRSVSVPGTVVRLEVDNNDIGVACMFTEPIRFSV